MPAELPRDRERLDSYLRAEQTGVRFETASELQEPAAEPAFDFGQARDLVRHRTLTTIASASLPACSVSWGLTCLRAARSPSGTSASRTSSTPGGSKATVSTRHESGRAGLRELKQAPTSSTSIHRSSAS